MEEPPDTTNPGCRLCLTVFSGDSEQSDHLLNIFHDQDANFSLKILDCTGVFISTEEDDDSAISTICTSCVETVHFIDEFRSLCRRAEKRCERLLDGAAGFDQARWEAYRHHVGELRRLLPTGEGDDSAESGYKPALEVKHEEEEQVDASFEWADAEDELEIKHELDGSEEENNLEEEDVLSRKQAKLDSSDERLKLAQALYEHEMIWNKSHAEYDNATKWAKVADQLSMSAEDLKRHWKCLRDVYHGRRRRLLLGTGDPDNPLLREPLQVLLEKMVGNSQPTRTRKKFRQPTVDRMKLAKAIYEKEIIWSRVHPHYNDQVLRDGAFEEVAVEFNIPATELRQQWRKLRDYYRLRCFRVMEGKLELDDPKLKEPLYVLLKKMLRDNMEVGKRAASSANITEETLEDGEESAANIAAIQSDKLALAQAFYEREFVWNRAHPTNAVKATREEAWQEMANEYNMSVPDLKTQWRYLRDGYRVKWKRLQARPNDEAAIQATLNPLYLLMDQMLQEGPAPQDQPEPNEEEATPKIRRPRNSYNAERRLTIAVAVHEQEILWNKKHPEYADHGKRELMWDQVASRLDIPCDELKQQWKQLRDLYRRQMVRVGAGKIPPNHPFLRQKLFRLLDRMLRDNMNVGMFNKAHALPRRKRRKSAMEKEEGDEDKAEGGETDDGEEKEVDLEFQEQDGEPKEVEKWGKPFDDPELRARLAEEITKREMLWNINHVDYSRGSLRGQVWTEIGNQFGLDRSHAIITWRRATHRHRRLLEVHGSVAPELLEQDPLHRMLHEVVYSSTTAGDQPKKVVWPPKRRYTGKKVYSDDGCIKVIQNGIPHYLRVCELCGKNVERSDFEYHMNRHNGLTPYACSYEGCDKRYGSKITRDRHEILVHTADAERFECEQCGQKFKYRSKLEYHQAMNHKSQNLPCTVCGKKLKHKHALRNHMQIHTQSGFGCPVCGRVLQKKHSLDVHMRIHTNEKPYPCVLCGQSFRLKVLLKTHLAKVHNMAIEELEGPGPSGK